MGACVSFEFPNRAFHYSSIQSTILSKSNAVHYNISLNKGAKQGGGWLVSLCHTMPAFCKTQTIYAKLLWLLPSLSPFSLLPILLLASSLSFFPMVSTPSLFLRQLSLCISGWLQAHIDSPAFASLALGLKMCATMANLSFLFFLRQDFTM